MRKLTDVYIKVDKRNHEKVSELLQREHLPYGCIHFNIDNIKGWSIREPKNKQKVSLAELKRLIDTIPTREEIIRLKRQISAYKMNLSLVNERCKELQRDNDILVDCMEKLDDKLEVTEKENERLKNINLTLKQTNDYLYDKKDTLLNENAKLKQRKWWQIWINK